MKLFYLATVLFAALVGIAQVSAKGYYCTKHIEIKRGDRCYMIYGYDERKKYYVRSKDLREINPSNYNYLLFIIIYYLLLFILYLFIYLFNNL